MLILCSEKKIDRIEDRLSSIENVLESLASKLGSLDIQKESPGSSSLSRSSKARIGKSPGLPDASTPAPFEGETTINSQSDYAREFLAQAVGSTPSIGQNADIKSALAALGDLVSQQSQNAASSNTLINRSLANLDPGELERPPWDLVTLVLGKAQSELRLSLSVIQTHLNRISNNGLCRDFPIYEDEKLKRNF